MFQNKIWYGSTWQLLFYQYWINSNHANKLMKLLLRLRRKTPTNELHMHLNILKVSDIYKSNVLSFVNEILSGRSPDIFKNYFILKNNQYDMRRKGQLNVPPCRTQICDKAVRVFGASQWNRLEKCMLQYRFKKCFEKQLLKYYMSRYNVWILLDANTNRCESN